MQFQHFVRLHPPYLVVLFGFAHASACVSVEHCVCTCDQFQRWRCLACLSQAPMHCSSCWKRRIWSDLQLLRFALTQITGIAQFSFVAFLVFNFCLLSDEVVDC